MHSPLWVTKWDWKITFAATVASLRAASILTISAFELSLFEAVICNFSPFLENALWSRSYTILAHRPRTEDVSVDLRASSALGVTNLSIVVKMTLLTLFSTVKSQHLLHYAFCQWYFFQVFLYDFGCRWETFGGLYC